LVHIQSDFKEGEGGISNCFLDFTIDVPKQYRSQPFYYILTGNYTDFKANPDNVRYNCTILDVYNRVSNRDDGVLLKMSDQVHVGNKCTMSRALHVYVDRDVTFTAKGTTVYGTTTDDFSLSFKKGWNEFYEEYILNTEYWIDERITVRNKAFVSNYYWILDV
jgi:hypothetical protein